MMQHDQLLPVPVAVISPSRWTLPLNCEPIQIPSPWTRLWQTILPQRQGKPRIYQVKLPKPLPDQEVTCLFQSVPWELGSRAPPLLQCHPALSTLTSRGLPSFLTYLTLLQTKFHLIASKSWNLNSSRALVSRKSHTHTHIYIFCLTLC